MLIAAPGSICEVWLVMGLFENAVEDVRKLLMDLSDNFVEGAKKNLLSRLNIETTGEEFIWRSSRNFSNFHEPNFIEFQKGLAWVSTEELPCLKLTSI